MEEFSLAEVREALKRAPEVVKDAFESDLPNNCVGAIQTRYGLHIDVIDKIGELVGYLLLGLIRPDEFISKLISAGIDTNTANSIAADINRDIFIPLRDAERGGKPIAPSEYADSTILETVTVDEPSQIRPVLPPLAVDYQQAPITLPGSSIPAPMPEVPVTGETLAPAVLEASPLPVAAAPLLPPASPIPADQFIHTVQHPMQPGWQPAASVHVYIPSPVAASAPQNPIPAMEAAASVPTLPEITPSTPVPPPAVPIPQPVAPTPLPTPPPIVRPHGSDPYREPIG